MTRHIKRGGKVWINIFPDKPVTEKPAETRMGSGKGNPERWVAVVRPGRVHVRALLWRSRRSLREAIDRAIQKLPIKAKFVDTPGGLLAMAKNNDLVELQRRTISSLKLAETKEELFNLRFQVVTGQMENYGQALTSREAGRGPNQ